ncbi:uncharacterized protein UDID_21027 [Ustilago sp. UG-2017a]|nr:uncharacterized protein UDID_21027 [Ustilago sp. UG-2017a]
MQCNLGRAEAASMTVGQGHERMRDQAKQLTSEAKGITNQGSVNLRLLRSFQPQVQARVSECELSDYIKRCNRRQVYPLNRARVNAPYLYSLWASSQNQGFTVDEVRSALTSGLLNKPHTNAAHPTSSPQLTRCDSALCEGDLQIRSVMLTDSRITPSSG